MKFDLSSHYNVRPMIRYLKDVQEGDQRSDFGINVRGICSAAGKTNMFSVLKGTVKYNPIHVDNIWRPKILKELLLVRENKLSLECDPYDLQIMINYIAAS